MCDVLFVRGCLIGPIVQGCGCGGETQAKKMGAPRRLDSSCSDYGKKTEFAALQPDASEPLGLEIQHRSSQQMLPPRPEACYP